MPNVFELQRLVDLRRNAEAVAQQKLACAIAARLQAEEEQSRLAAETQNASDKLAAERIRLASLPPKVATQAIQQQRYLTRLRDEYARRRKRAEDHRRSIVGPAASNEAASRSELTEAHGACATAEKLLDRAHAEAKRVADRRAEDAASDAAHARYRRS